MTFLLDNSIRNKTTRLINMSGNKISLSLGGGRKPPPPSNGVKRPRAALQDDEEEGANFGRTEEVSHFDKRAGGAIDEKQQKSEAPGPLTIQPQANRDWREKANQRKRQKSGLPEGQGGTSADLDARMRDVEAKVEASKPKFGLNTYKKSASEDDNGNLAVEAAAESQAAQTPSAQSSNEHNIHQQKTDDELAMDALLGKTSTNKHFVIESNDAPMSEADAYGHDIASAPASATLDDYARVPVEQFGAALLRGMGWKDGEGIGSQKGKKMPRDTGKVPARRANLLGIGAKEDAAVASEMGAWGRASKGKEIKIYNPVLLRDKNTGKMYTEEELEKKKQDDERAKYEMEFEDKEKDRERRRRDRHAEASSKSSRRDREEGRDRSRDRDRRRRDSDSEEEYRKRKEKDRRRRREDDYERDRSHRHRDRDNDGDRDRHDRARRDHDRQRDRRR